MAFGVFLLLFFRPIFGRPLLDVSTNFAQKSVLKPYFSTFLACQRVLHDGAYGLKAWSDWTCCPSLRISQLLLTLRQAWISFGKFFEDLFSRRVFYVHYKGPEWLQSFDINTFSLFLIFGYVNPARRSGRYLTYLRSVVSVFAWPSSRAMTSRGMPFSRHSVAHVSRKSCADQS